MSVLFTIVTGQGAQSRKNDTRPKNKSENSEGKIPVRLTQVSNLMNCSSRDVISTIQLPK